MDDPSPSSSANTPPQSPASATPRVSIITVTYNAADLIERTVASVAGQTYPNIEYIVVDGASTDGTLDLIEKYAEQDVISRWVSEPDAGIYDAMNKGLGLAKGEYVWFMNAGDTIFEAETLAKVMATQPNGDVYYGEAMTVDEKGKPLGLRLPRPPKRLHWRSLQRGMVVCHQAFILRRSLATAYNLKYRYCADIDWVIQGLKRSKKIVNAEQTVCTFLVGGFSKKHERRSWKDRFDVLTKHYGLITNIINHGYISLRFLARNALGGKREPLSVW